MGSIPRVAANDIEPAIAAALTDNSTPTAKGKVPGAEQRRILLDQRVAKVVVGKEQLKVFIKGDAEGAEPLLVTWKRRPPKLKREVIFQEGGPDDLKPMRARNRRLLLRSIARARLWLDQLASGQVADVQAIALQEGRTTRSVNMTMGLAFLEPAIVMSAIKTRAAKRPRPDRSLMICRPFGGRNDQCLGFEGHAH